MGGESRYVCRKNNNNKVIAFFLCWQPPPDSGVHPSVRDEEAEESDRDISRVYCRAPRSRTKRGRPLEMQAAAVDASGCCVSVTRSGDCTLKDIYTSAHLAANGQFLLVASSVGWCRRSRSPPFDQIRLLFFPGQVETFCGRQSRDSDTHRRVCVCGSVIPFNSRPAPHVR